MRCWHLEASPFKVGKAAVEARKQMVDLLVRYYGIKRLRALVTRVSNLFCPPNCYAQFGAHDVYTLLAYLAERAFDMKIKRPYRFSKPTKERDGSRELHERLVEEATIWLRKERGERQVEYEVPFQSGRADIATENGKVYIECGATRPSKVWQLFEHEGDKVELVVFNRLGMVVFNEGPQIRSYREAYFEYSRRLSLKLSAIDALLWDGKK